MSTAQPDVVPPEAVLYQGVSALDGAPQRHIRHPGTPDARVDVQPCRLRKVPIEPGALPTGLPLLQGLGRAMDERGVHSAVLCLEASAGLRFDPYPYVLPALSRDPAHAVYFSERHEAPGAVSLMAGAITYGRNVQGEPALHGHLDWVEEGDTADRQGAEPRRGCGHVLPHEAIVAACPGAIEVWAIEGARFEIVADEFTRFSLFKPRPMAVKPSADGDSTSRPGLALRVPPNVDLCLALEAVCRERGINSATLRGGVGSTVGVVFGDGRVVEPFVTETLVNQGRVVTDATTGELRAEIDVTLIDYQGGRHQGRLARGRNPVLVTFELVLEIVGSR